MVVLCAIFHAPPPPRQLHKPRACCLSQAIASVTLRKKRGHAAGFPAVDAAAPAGASNSIPGELDSSSFVCLVATMEQASIVPSVLQIVARNVNAKPSIPSRSAKSSSAYRGVSSQGNRWRARICIDKVCHSVAFLCVRVARRDHRLHDRRCVARTWQ